MKLFQRMKVASEILRGKTTDATRVVTESIDINHASVGIFGGLEEETGRQEKYEIVTIKELQDEPLEKILPKIIRSDPAIDQVVNFFTTLVAHGSDITAGTSRGERGIEEIKGLLQEKKNPIELAVVHCASSLIVRGDICIETEFNESNQPENLWVPDPKWVEWRLLTENDTQRWALGHFKRNRWQEIESPNVHYIAGDPLIGERSSRSPLQSALFPALAQSSMIRSLQSILDVHAWAQTVFVVKKLEMIKLDKEGASIEDVNDQVKEAMQLISTKLAKKKQDQVMGVTDDIEPMQLPGSGDHLTFTKEIGSLYDKRVSAGTKTPSTVGGPSERADYSTKEQGLFYSLHLESSQTHIKNAMEWAITRFLRSMGITDDPIYTSKSVNVQARMIEAQAFQEVMKGVESAVTAGIPLPLAIEFFEEEAGQTFSANLKAQIKEQYQPPEPNTPTSENDDDSPEEDPENQTDNYLHTAVSRFLKKKGIRPTRR